MFTNTVFAQTAIHKRHHAATARLKIMKIIIYGIPQINASFIKNKKIIFTPSQWDTMSRTIDGLTDHCVKCNTIVSFLENFMWGTASKHII